MRLDGPLPDHTPHGRTLVTMALCAICIAPPVRAQQQPEPPKLRLDSLFLAHRLPLTFGPRGTSGPGWDLLVREGASAQFVMVGESHGLREIPLFTAQLFEALQERAGYAYLGLENGPIAMEQLNAPDVRGNFDATVALANRYVNALQFRNDQELEMIATAGRRSVARSRPLWGLDQEWGALHVLERLRELAPTETHSMLDAMIAEAAELEAFRPSDAHPRFINRNLSPGRLESLEKAFANGPAEAERLLRALRTSVEIYSARVSGPAIYESNHRREQYMRQRFMEEYRAAVAAGDTLPRVVLKFGQWHALRGVLNWGQVEPFGTFLGEFARSNGLASLHIWTGLVNEPGHVWTLMDFPDYVPLARAGTTDGWWIVDVRPIRALVAGGRVEPLNPELQKVVFGFDLALLIGSGNRATTERLPRS